MPDAAPPRPRGRWLTKRMFFSVCGLAIASGALFSGKMTDGCWVYALAVIIAGHHAEDLIKAWKGG